MKRNIIAIILTLIFYNLSSSQTLDILKDFEPGKKIIFSYTKTGYPSSFLAPEETFNFFSGTIEITTDTIVFSQTDSVKSFYINIRKKGKETVKYPTLEIISNRNIDAIYSRVIKEFTTENYSSGSHRVSGWIIPDTVSATPACFEDSTVFYKYPYYYRYYTFPTNDTLDFQLDTLVLTDQWTDCLDIGYTSKLSITTNEGLISFYSDFFNWFGWSEVEIYKKIEVTTSISDDTNIQSFFLYPNYPNPFNPYTTIKYQLSKPGFTKLAIFDLLGRRIKVLVDGFETQGLHTIVFDASDLSSGMYFYTLKSKGFFQSRKFILLK